MFARRVMTSVGTHVPLLPRIYEVAGIHPDVGSTRPISTSQVVILAVAGRIYSSGLIVQLGMAMGWLIACFFRVFAPLLFVC